MEPGDYAMRGGIIDIYPPGDRGPVRLDLFGDVLDGARRFDPVTQRTTEKLDMIELAPVSEVILDEAAITRFRQNYRIEFGAAGTDDPLYEAVSAGRKHQGVEHWLPFFHERLETLFDYLPEATASRWTIRSPRRGWRGGTASPINTRRASMRWPERSAMDSVYKPRRRGCCIWMMRRGRRRWRRQRVCAVPALAAGHGAGGDGCGRRGSGAISRRSASRKSISLFGALADHIEGKAGRGAGADRQLFRRARASV